MTTTSMQVQRTSTILRPDQSRVLLRPFRPETTERASRIIARIMSLPESQIGPLLNDISAEFSQRHQQIRKSFLERFEQVRDLVLTDEEISEERKLLIGAYFVCEFSLESAALSSFANVASICSRQFVAFALRYHFASTRYHLRLILVGFAIRPESKYLTLASYRDRSHRLVEPRVQLQSILQSIFWFCITLHRIRCRPVLCK
jgi:hypothetical protein